MTDFELYEYLENKLKEARKQIAELEKENAELNETLGKCAKMPVLYCLGAKETIAKAKEIIREFVEWATWQGSNCPNFKSIQDKAEQFLKDSEVEK